MNKSVSILMILFAVLLVGCKKEPETVILTTIQVTVTPEWEDRDIVAEKTAEAEIRETQDARPLPISIEEAKQIMSIQVSAGDSADDIFNIYGQPSKDFYPENYNPRTRRIIQYSQLGLKFGLTSNKISDIFINAGYTGEIYGLRLGDQLQRGLDIFESKPLIFQEQNEDVYSWPDFDPDWFFHISTNSLVNKGRIVQIHMHNREYYGDWVTEETQ